MPRIVIEKDPALGLAAVVLDPSGPEDGRRAFADFLAHDEPDFAGWCERLHAKIPGLFPAETILVDSPEALKAALADADGVIVEGLKIGEAELAGAKKLAFVQKFGGLPANIDVAACERRGISVMVQRRRVNIAVAEHGFALMIALAKRLNVLDGLVDDAGLRQAGYRPDPFDRRYTVNSNFARVPGLRTLHGSVLGALGLGEVGREVASRAKAFGMTVLCHQRRPLSAQEEKELGVTYASLDDLLRRSDFVSVHLPLTESTRGFINRDAFARMKPGAILVNIARAEIIDYDDLLQALREKRLGGFGLDTGYKEPADPDEPLRGFKEVMLTPHTAPAGRGNVLADMEEMCLKMWKALRLAHA
jgi:phosphoglycerate dehydrogenase-like enzyme